MQAIQTKFLSPTNSRGSRVKACCERGSMIVEWDHALNSEGNHKRAIMLLCERFTKEDSANGDKKSIWSEPKVFGWIQTGMVGVFSNSYINSWS